MTMSAADKSYTSSEFKQLANQATSWCGLNGLMYTDGKVPLSWSAAPLSLIPNKFPREAFAYSKDIQPTLNLLVDRISRDRAFLLDQLSSVTKSDDFVQKLVDIYCTVSEKQLVEGLQFGILRSDYMVNEADGLPLQIEVNTIASSFGCLSKKVELFQRSVLEQNDCSSGLASSTSR